MGSWFEDETVGVEKRYMILIICHPARHMLGDSLPPPPIGKRSVESPALSTPPPQGGVGHGLSAGLHGNSQDKALGWRFVCSQAWVGGITP